MWLSASSAKLYRLHAVAASVAVVFLALAAGVDATFYPVASTTTCGELTSSGTCSSGEYTICLGQDTAGYAWHNVNSTLNGFHAVTVYQRSTNHGGLCFGLQALSDTHLGTSTFGFYNSSGSIGYCLALDAQANDVYWADPDELTVDTYATGVGYIDDDSLHTVEVTFFAGAPTPYILYSVDGSPVRSFNVDLAVAHDLRMGWTCRNPTGGNGNGHSIIHSLEITQPACLGDPDGVCGSCAVCDPTNSTAQANGCVWHSSGTPCSDGDDCLSGDTCDGAGTCSPGPTMMDCDDANECTTDTCSASTCSNINNSNPCDDGNACTVDDTCSLGVCAGNLTVCMDCNSCNVTTGACEPNDLLSCDDGDFCTETDFCSGGSCQPGSLRACDDGNECTTDSCTGGMCVNANNTMACDDNNECTLGDVCAGGVCVSGSPKDCSDGIECTQDLCNPGDGVCSNPDEPNGTMCDDGDPCHENQQCFDGACTLYANVTCPVCQYCNGGDCDPDFTVDDQFCDDGDTCTTDTVCNAGSCTGGTGTICDDSQLCTTDTCEFDMCNFTPRANNEDCENDGDLCTQERCTGGVCQAPGPREEYDDCNDCDAATGLPIPLTGGSCTDNFDAACHVPASGQCVSGVCVWTQLACDGQCETGTCTPTVGCDAVADNLPCKLPGSDVCAQADWCQTGSCVMNVTTDVCTTVYPAFDDACYNCNSNAATSVAACSTEALLEVADPNCNPSACWTNAADQAGRDALCDDEDPCTVDSCNQLATIGCVSTEDSTIDGCGDNSATLIGLGVAATVVVAGAAAAFMYRDRISDYLADRALAKNKAISDGDGGEDAGAGEGKHADNRSGKAAGGTAAAAAAAAAGKAKNTGAGSRAPVRPSKKPRNPALGQQSASEVAAAAALAGKKPDHLESYLVSSDWKLLHALLTVLPKEDMRESAPHIAAIYEANSLSETTAKWMIQYVIDKRKFTGNFGKDQCADVLAKILEPWQKAWAANVLKPAVAGIEETEYRGRKLKTVVEAVLGAITSSPDQFSRPFRNVLLYAARKSPKDSRYGAWASLILDLTTGPALRDPVAWGVMVAAPSKRVAATLTDVSLVLHHVATGELITRDSQAGHLKMFNKWLQEQRGPWRKFVDMAQNKGKTYAYKQPSYTAAQRAAAMREIQKHMASHIDALTQHLVTAGAPQLSDLVSQVLGVGWGAVAPTDSSGRRASKPRRASSKRGVQVRSQESMAAKKALQAGGDDDPTPGPSSAAAVIAGRKRTSSKNGPGARPASGKRPSAGNRSRSRSRSRSPAGRKGSAGANKSPSRRGSRPRTSSSRGVGFK